MRRVPGRSQTARRRAAILPDRAAGALLAPIAASPVLAQPVDDLPVIEPGATRVQAPAPRVGVPGSPLPADRARLEALVQGRYRGTLVSYQRLPANAQDGCFEPFRRGVPVAELREKIVDRYLQR